MPEGLPGPEITADRQHAASEDQAEQARDARMVRSVRWRLVLFSGGATLLVLLLLGVAIYTAVANSLATQAVAQLQERAGSLTEFIENPRRGDPPIDVLVGGRTSGTFAYLVDPEGTSYRPRTVRDIDGLPDAAAIDAARGGQRDIREVTAGEGTPFRLLTEPATTRAGQRWLIQIVQERTAEVNTLGSLLQVLIGGGVLALVLASALGAAYATRALVPIRASLHAQREALRRQREFAADASHELRTPLTIVRSSVEDLRLHEHQPVAEVGTALDDIDAEVGHLTSLVEDLLLLARSDSGALDMTLQPVELGDVAADAASAMMSPAAIRGVRIEVDPEPVMVVGDALRLRQVVTILVDNAVRHSPDGGEVRVRVRRERSAAQLVVEDQGPGVRPEDLEHVFDRFWRAPGSPGGGTGLGLAIAASIVTRLDGRIGVAAGPQGGAMFTVELPLAGLSPRSV